MSKTVLTPTEALSALIERATNGEEVTAEELALANAAVQLSELQEVGETRREKKRAEQAADKAREDAKAEAAKILEGFNPQSILVRYDAAVDALEAIVTEAGKYNDAINSAARTLGKGGVPSMSSWGGYEHEQEVRADPHFDQDNFVMWNQGNQVSGLAVAGNGHSPVDPSPLVAWATLTVADRHHGLPIPYGQSISRRLDRPNKATILEQRERDAA